MTRERGRGHYDRGDRRDRWTESDRQPEPDRRTETERDGGSGNTDLTRRRALAAGAGAVTIGLAGCLETRDGDVPDPIVADDRIDDGWRVIQESEGTVFEESYGPVTVSALQRSIVYEYADVAEAVAETLDASGSPVLFFVARIDLRPAIDQLPFAIGRGRLMEEVHPAAEAAFRNQLEESGLRNVEHRSTEEIEVNAGHDATKFVFGGGFPIDTAIDLPVGGTEQVSGTVEVEGNLAVWHDGTDVLLAGGAYPTERLSDPLDVNDDLLTEFLDDGSPLLQDPETFSEVVDALIVSVE